MAASIPSCAIRTIVESMLRSVHENVLGGIPGNILGHRQKCKSTIGCATRTRAHAQLIASFPWTPARRAAYSHL